MIRLFAAVGVVIAGWNVMALAQEEKTVRVGLMKAEHIWADPEASFEKAERLIRQAMPQGPQIIVTSECWANGYHQMFKAAGKPNPRGWKKDRDDRLMKTDSAVVKKYAALCDELDIHMVLSLHAIRDGEESIAAVFLGPDGKTVGEYHKHWNDPDADLPVFETELGTFGICICYDRQLPETCRILRLKGAEAVLIPTYGRKDEMNRIMMRTRAYENGFYAVFSHAQQALVTGPKGQILLDEMGPEEKVFCVDIDLSKVDAKNLVISASELKLYEPYIEKWGLRERFGKR
jgi:predicted amidohydrolase